MKTYPSTHYHFQGTGHASDRTYVLIPYDPIQVQAPMTKVGDFLLASGCMPHVCTINEAAFAIDLKIKRIHAAIYEKDSPTKYFNEDKAPTLKFCLIGSWK